MSWLTWAVGVASAAAPDVAPWAEAVRPTVVMLERHDVTGALAANGTGFLISADGRVATNQHVSEIQPDTAVFSDGSRRAVLGEVASDEAKDVAILQLEPGSYPPLSLASAPPAVGDPVLVVGSPMGLEQTVTTGAVSALRPDGPSESFRKSGVAEAPLLQITALIAHGSSGSPVVNAAGEVVGIVQSGAGDEQIYFAVDVSVLRAMREAAPDTYTAFPDRRQPLVIAGSLVLGLLGLAVAPSFREAWRALRVRRSRKRRR